MLLDGCILLPVHIPPSSLALLFSFFFFAFYLQNSPFLRCFDILLVENFALQGAVREAYSPFHMTIKSCEMD